MPAIKQWRNLAASGSYTRYPNDTGSWDVYSSGYSIGTSHARGPDGKYRSGGAWQMQKTDNIVYASTVDKWTGSGGSNHFLSGSVHTNHVSHGSLDGAPALLSDSKMDSEGASAMAQVLPTSPQFSLLTSLGELGRDGLPAIPGSSAVWRDKTQAARAMPAGEYLNVEFGWKPMVADLRNFCKTVNQSNKILQQYLKSSDVQIRRSFEYPSDWDSSSRVGSTILYPTALNQFGDGATFSTFERKKWFEGVFKYHVPDGNGAFGRVAQYASLANQLLGLKPTPEVIWNISPWSWAADWFGNVGDIMTNVSALSTDGLQLAYGFEMCSQIRTHQTTAGAIVNGRFNKKVQHTFGLKTTHTTLQRRPANPYGFGLSGLATTTRQKAIAAAIALSLTSGSKSNFK